MKRKIIRQVEIEYEVDIDIDNMKYKSMASDTQWLKSQIRDYFYNTYQSRYESFLPSIDSYCRRVNQVETIYTHEDKNLYVYSNINAKVVRDITISNEVIEIPPKK